MQIKNYDVLINEKQASCGLIVDPTEYNIDFFDDKYLNYEVDTENCMIHVYSDKNKVSFLGMDNRLRYYAFKTETLVLLVGTRHGSNHFTKVYEACLI
jgi:hypothetical protein